MQFYRIVFSSSAAILGLALLTGCGPSEEEKIAEKLAQRGDPAHARLINITNSELSFEWQTDRPLEERIQPFSASSFRMIGTKDKTVSVIKGQTDPETGKFSNKEQIFTEQFTAEPEGLYNIVAIGEMGDVRHVMFNSSSMAAEASANLDVVFIDEKGSSIDGSVTLTNGTNSYELSGTTGKTQVALGDYQLEGLDVANGGKIEDDSFYTLFVIETRDGKRIGMLLRNALTDKPAAGGMG